MRKALAILLMFLVIAVVIYRLTSKRQEEEQVPGEAKMMTPRPSAESSQKEALVGREPQVSETQASEGEELIDVADRLDELPEEGNKILQKEVQVVAPSSKPEAKAEEEWKEEVRAAYRKDREAYRAIQDELAPIQKENYHLNRRLEEIILLEMKESDKDAIALREEFDELRKRNGEISPIIDRLMMERERIIEEFEDNYRVSWAEAHALTYGQSRAATVE